MKDYKVVNGISFDQRTPDKVCNILANYCGNRYRRNARTSKECALETLILPEILKTLWQTIIIHYKLYELWQH